VAREKDGCRKPDRLREGKLHVVGERAKSGLDALVENDRR